MPDREHSRAVLIGNAVYDDPEVPDIPAVVRNLAGLRAALCDPEVGGLAAEHCTVLEGPRHADNAPSLVADIGREAEDVFLLYYAGHAFRSSDHRLLLTWADTRQDQLLFTTIKIDELLEAVRHSSAQVRIVILDCCFSGGALGGQLLGTEDADVLVDAAALAGGYTLTSSAANQWSNAPDGAEYTTFTGALIRLLHDGEPDGPEFLSLRRVFSLLEHVLAETHAPKPKQANHGSAGSLFLVRNRAYVAGDDRSRQADEPEYVTLLHEVTDPRLALKGRIEALEAIGRRAPAEKAYRLALARVADNRDVPTLIQVNALCRLVHLGDTEVALELLSTMAPAEDPHAVLARLLVATEIPQTDEEWRRRTDPDWILPSRRTGRLSNERLWGLWTAILLTATGLPSEDRVLAARELGELGEPVLAQALLAGLALYRHLNSADKDLIQTTLAELSDR